jgi:hypothetical protein
MEKMNDTTRRYPRTLKEAFPHDAELAEWIYRDPQTLPVGYYVIAAIFICLFVFIVLLLRNLCTI